MVIQVWTNHPLNHASINGDDQIENRVFLVPYRWLMQFQQQCPSSSSLKPDEELLYCTSPATKGGVEPTKIIDSISDTDIVLHLHMHLEDHSSSSSAHCYALIHNNLWFNALAWHEHANSLSVDDAMKNVYAVTLRVSDTHQLTSMAVKISRRDNNLECFKQASMIFNLDSEQIQIWDFSGQMAYIVFKDNAKGHVNNPQMDDDEIFLVMHIYASSDFLTTQEGKNDDTGTQLHNKSSHVLDNTTALNGSSHRVGSMGITGLKNLGNTCFMNSAIQCLAHTPHLVEYFLGNYSKEINTDNPLGMHGKLALAFGLLLRKLWVPDSPPVVPNLFKEILDHFAPQFSGSDQHDSQELLAFLLDGLHEDLNRVKIKPYVEPKDALDRPDEEVADEYWENHLSRNDSIIVTTFQGQYRSKLVCPTCNQISVTFDPFMYLSLPLPSISMDPMRTITLTLFSTDGVAQPTLYTITVPKNGNYKDLFESLTDACSLNEDESLLVVEVYFNRIIRCLEEPSDSLDLIRDRDILAAYRIPKDHDNFPLVYFMYQHMDEQDDPARLVSYSKHKPFVPLATRLPGISNDGSVISNLFLKLLNPFLCYNTHMDDQSDDYSSSDSEVTSTEVTSSDCASATGTMADSNHILNEIKFYVIDLSCSKIVSEIEMNKEVSIPENEKVLRVFACWPKRIIENYREFLSSLQNVHKYEHPRKCLKSISLYSCIEAFLEEEPLGPEDMWYCSSCKVHKQAIKQLRLWKVPEVLVIHLKRFSFNEFQENKLKTFVNFPIHDLDLSAYITPKSEQDSIRYELFAISNHYGTMASGHYTAYVMHSTCDKWFEFDDNYVTPIDEDMVKTNAAYVLFYKRAQSEKMDRSK